MERLELRLPNDTNPLVLPFFFQQGNELCIIETHKSERDLREKKNPDKRTSSRRLSTTECLLLIMAGRLDKVTTRNLSQSYIVSFTPARSGRIIALSGRIVFP